MKRNNENPVQKIITDLIRTSQKVILQDTQNGLTIIQAVQADSAWTIYNYNEVEFPHNIMRHNNRKDRK